MNAILSVHWFLFAAVWYTANGVLHDIFILRAHKGPYDRELLRLLMDGHVLILSGIIAAICWHMLRHNLMYGAILGLVIATSMVVYCLMIFPFLKSFVTLAISLALICVSARVLLQMNVV